MRPSGSRPTPPARSRSSATGAEPSRSKVITTPWSRSRTSNRARPTSTRSPSTARRSGREGRLPALGHPHDLAGRKVEPLLRVVPRLGPARAAVHARRRRQQARLRARRAAGPGPAHDARAPRGMARRVVLARGPDLRRRGLGRRPGVHPLAARHQRRPGRAGRGLRGVHAPVLGRVERSGNPVAALDRAVGHDLRRPRRERRLEHLRDLGAPDAPHVVVGRAHHRGLHVLLDLPAPRQPFSEGTEGRRPLRQGTRGRKPDPRPARVRLPGRP